MPGILDLNWSASASDTTPPRGKSGAIVRGDTYAHVITFWNDAEQTEPFMIEGDVIAQLRLERLKSSTAGDPTAEFTVVVDDNEVTLSLTAAETLALPDKTLYWDLQLTNGATVTTLLSGTVKVRDDVTR